MLLLYRSVNLEMEGSVWSSLLWCGYFLGILLICRLSLHHSRQIFLILCRPATSIMDHGLALALASSGGLKSLA